MDRTIVRLKVASLVLAPTDISSTIGIECDKSWLAGEVRRPSIVRAKENMWMLGSLLSESSGLEEHLQALRQRVQPFEFRFAGLVGRASVELSCVIYRSSAPALNFTPDDVGWAARLGASLDVDLYHLPAAGDKQATGK